MIIVIILVADLIAIGLGLITLICSVAYDLWADGKNKKGL